LTELYSLHATLGFSLKSFLTRFFSLPSNQTKFSIIMDGFNDTFNATMYAVQLISEVYTFCYVNLQKSNIPLPAPDQVMSTVKATVSYILSYLPAAIQEAYSALSKIVVQSNFVGVFLSLLILYIAYCVVMATLHMFYRLIYGFVRFSLMVFLLGALLYIVRYQLIATTSTNEHVTKSYGYTT
jgi:hypothetical protein